MPDKPSMNLLRRKILTYPLAVASTTLPLSSHLYAARNIQYPDRYLSLFHAHTGEKITMVYWSQGKYLLDNLASINWILRDYHSDNVKPIDPRLLNLLYLLQRKLSVEPSKYPFQILSAYRTKSTNEQLRETIEGVSRNSFHLQGRALDFNIPGIAQSAVHKAAIHLAAGGVGNYPDAQFIHLDTGPFRTWSYD